MNKCSTSAPSPREAARPSASRQLTLVNFGGEAVVIRSIGITQGYDHFSVSPLPVTTLQPGDSILLVVNFNPLPNGSSRGLLVVDSDIEVLGGTVLLRGSGQQADAPDIGFEYYTNNLGGAQVGRLTSYLNKPLIVNRGTGPLSISEIRTAAGLGQNEYVVHTNRALPVTLEPGEALQFDILFQPSKIGIRPGSIEIVSNDPDTPVLRQPFTGTGVVTNDDFRSFESLDGGNDYVAVEDSDEFTNNLPTLRARTDQAGNWEFFLPAETFMHVATFDPVSGLIAHGYGLTGAAGQRTDFNIGAFGPSNTDDSDGDGLPDDIEFAVGTSSSEADSDGDGQNDFAEFDSGQNPLDGRPTTTGILSAIATSGPVHDVQVAADFADSSRKLAYLAVGVSGVAIVDVTDFAKPVLVGQVDLPGATALRSDINKISLDAAGKVLAASSPRDGVFVVDVSDPTAPRLLVRIPPSGNDTVAAVLMFDGRSFRRDRKRNPHVHRDNRGAGRVFCARSRAGAGHGAARLQSVCHNAGPGLGQLSAANSRDHADWPGRGERALDLPGAAATGDPFIAERVVWIPAADRVVTVDIERLDAPRLIQGSQMLPPVINSIRLNGSGLGVLASGLQGAGTAAVLVTDDPGNVQRVFTQFALPATAEDVALSSGLAYFAGGESGLQVVNFLAFDQGQTPPDVLIDPLAGDVDPNRVGLQMAEATTVVVPAQISDDVQVRQRGADSGRRGRSHRAVLSLRSFGSAAESG